MSIDFKCENVSGICPRTLAIFSVLMYMLIGKIKLYEWGIFLASDGWLWIIDYFNISYTGVGEK